MSPDRGGLRHRAVAGQRQANFRPIRCGLFGLAASLLILIAACSSNNDTVKTDTVKVAGQSDRGSGRLVLEWQQPSDYEVLRAGPYIFVRFARPFSSDLEAARRS